MAAPVVNVPATDLASSYDIHDPVHEYAIPEPLATAQVPPVAAAATQPTAQPAQQTAQPVLGTTPVAQTQQPAPSTQKHPDWLLRKVTELGLNPLLIERLDTPELTQIAFSEIERARQEMTTRQTASTVTTPAVQVAPQQQNGQPQTSNPNSQGLFTPAWDWGIHDDVDDSGRPVKRQFTDDDIHPALAYHIKKQAERIEKLEQHLSAIQKHATTSVQSQIDTQFDSAFNKIGGVFGTGTVASLQGKPEIEKRTLVYNAVKAMFSTIPAQAREAMGIEKAVFMFAKSLFGVDTPQVAAAATNGQPTAEQFRNGVVGTPTQRRANDSPIGREKAIEEAQNWWKENQAAGGIPQSGGTSMDEFFPIG